MSDKIPQVLNQLSSDSGKWRQRSSIVDVDTEMIEKLSSQAMKFVWSNLENLELDMRAPIVELLGILWPGIAVAENEVVSTSELEL